MYREHEHFLYIPQRDKIFDIISTVLRIVQIFQSDILISLKEVGDYGLNHRRFSVRLFSVIPIYEGTDACSIHIPSVARWNGAGNTLGGIL